MSMIITSLACSNHTKCMEPIILLPRHDRSLHNNSPAFRCTLGY